jgi:hypothetical protein
MFASSARRTPGVQQQHDDGCVAAGIEVLAGARLQQPPQRVVRDDQDRLVRHDGWLHAHHGVLVDLFFFLEPAVEDAQHLVVGGGGASRAVGEELAEEGLQVGAGGVGERLAAGVEERLSLAGAGQVLGDRVVGAVLSSQVPREGSDQRAQVGRFYGGIMAHREEVLYRCAPSRTGPGHEDDQRFRWSVPVRWACEDLNLGPLPYQQNTGNRCGWSFAQVARNRRGRS